MVNMFNQIKNYRTLIKRSHYSYCRLRSLLKITILFLVYLTLSVLNIYCFPANLKVSLPVSLLNGFKHSPIQDSAGTILVPLEGSFIRSQYETNNDTDEKSKPKYSIEPDLPIEFWTENVKKEFITYQFMAEFMRLCWGYGTEYTNRYNGTYNFKITNKVKGPFEVYLWGGSHIAAERHFERVPFDKDHDIILLSPHVDVVRDEILNPLIAKYMELYGDTREGDIVAHWHNKNIGWGVLFRKDFAVHVAPDSIDTNNNVKEGKDQTVYLDIWAYDFIDIDLWNKETLPYKYSARPDTVDEKREAMACVGMYKIDDAKHCSAWWKEQTGKVKPAAWILDEYMPGYNTLLGPYIVPRLAQEENLKGVFSYDGFMKYCKFDHKPPALCSSYYKDHHFVFTSKVTSPNFIELQMNPDEFLGLDATITSSAKLQHWESYSPAGMVIHKDKARGDVYDEAIASLNIDSNQFVYKSLSKKIGNITSVVIYEKAREVPPNKKQMFTNKLFIAEKDLFRAGLRRRTRHSSKYLRWFF